jgi:hypothetical protein
MNLKLTGRMNSLQRKAPKSPCGDSPHPAVDDLNIVRGGEPTQVGLVLVPLLPRFQPPRARLRGVH